MQCLRCIQTLIPRSTLLTIDFQDHRTLKVTFQWFPTESGIKRKTNATAEFLVRITQTDWPTFIQISRKKFDTSRITIKKKKILYNYEDTIIIEFLRSIWITHTLQFISLFSNFYPSLRQKLSSFWSQDRWRLDNKRISSFLWECPVLKENFDNCLCLYIVLMIYINSAQIYRALVIHILLLRLCYSVIVEKYVTHLITRP